MKIAQVTSLQESVPPRFKNGLEFVVSYLTEELVKRGHKVTLFAPADSKTAAKLFSIYPIGVTNDPQNTQPACYFSFLNLTTALNYSLGERFEIIHSHLFVTPTALMKFSNTCLVNTYHNPIDREEKAFYKPPYLSYRHHVLDVRSQIFHVFVSSAQKRQFAAVWPKEYLDGRSFVVHNGLPLENFEYNGNPSDYFAFLGYMTENKGAHVAVEIARKTGIKLRIAGTISDIDSQNYFDDYIKPFVDGGKIEFVGALEHKEKVSFLKNAQAIFIPIQWEEPFGLVMIEAMACGTPVIGLNRASVPEVVKNKVTGFICRDVSEMIQTVFKIDKIERRACRARVEENFSVKAMVDGYEQVYQKIYQKLQNQSRVV